jgi:hypothetical protein
MTNLVVRQTLLVQGRRNACRSQLLSPSLGETKARSPYSLSTGAQRSGEICGFFSPCLAQVGPGRVGLLDEPYFLCASPVFDLLFSINRVVDVPIALVPNQAMASVIGRETRNDCLPVFLGASPHAIGYTNIEDVCPASDDVDVVAMLSHCFSGLRAK